MGIMSLGASFLGCLEESKTPERPTEKLSSISQSHMDRTYCYSFRAR